MSVLLNQKIAVGDTVLGSRLPAALTGLTVATFALAGAALWIDLPGTVAPSRALFTAAIAAALVAGLLARERSRRLAAALTRIEAQFTRGFDASPVGLLLVEPETGRVVLVNASACAMLGRDCGEVVGRTTLELGMWSSTEERDTFVRDAGDSGSRAVSLMVDGQVRRLKTSFVITDCEYRTCKLVALMDYTVEHRLIERQTLYDPLTGLANRALLQDRLDRELKQAPTRQVLVLIIDIDGFHELNDAYGHAAGDAILKSVAARIVRTVGNEATVARLGGDTFAVGVVVADQLAPEAVAERLRAALHEEPLGASGSTAFLEVSIGAAVSMPDENAEGLLRRADSAMVAAKSAGHASYRLSAAPASSEDRGLIVSRELVRSIELGQLSLLYQPVMDARSGACVRTEALVRWSHPELGAVAPSDFIRAAEETGFIRPLTLWVLMEALRQWRAWANVGVRVDMGVNLSSRNLRSRELVDRVQTALEMWGVPPAALHLEITETALLSDIDSVRIAIDKLRATGIRFSIDDFGTGYSALGQLRRVPVDELKVDASFVSTMTRDPASAAIVRSAISLAHDLGARVVAEGVEDEETLARLRVLGCDLFQGYLFARPMRPGEFRAWYREYPARRREGGTQWTTLTADTSQPAAISLT